MAQYCDNFYFRDSDNDSFEFWNGLRGPAGPQGTPGPPGSAAEASITGTPEGPRLNLTLPQGQQGPTGPQGETGATGVTFTPSVSISGDISWTNDGWRPNPQSVNIRGPQGPQGRGVAVGGSAGQVLKKKSATNYDTEWAPDPNANVGIVQNGDTATQNISKRQYVIWKGALYIASAAIASGATLSDSNLTAVTGGGLNQFLARSQQGRIVASGSETIQLDSDSNGIVVFTGAGDSHKDIAVFRCTDQGNVSIKSMLNSSVVFTTATNSLTITNTATTAILPYFIMSW